MNKYRLQIFSNGFLLDRMRVQISSEGSGSVQEIENEWHNEAANEHWYWPEHPEEERERQVESPQPQRPEEAPPVQVPRHVLNRVPSALGRGHGGKEADVRVVPYGLHVAEECHEEAEQDGEELDRGHDGGLVPVDQFGWGWARLVADVYTYQRAQGDGRGCQERRRHYVVPYRLNGQYTIFEWILSIYQT